MGGEPTIRDDILDLIRFAKNLNFKRIILSTNGRMFSYPDFTKKIIEAGLDAVIFSIHGHNAKIHDYLTGVRGSFNQTIRGLNNLFKMGFSDIRSNTMIVKQNFRYLPRIGKFIAARRIKNSDFIFPYCNKGGSYYRFYKIVPKISQAAPYIKKCFDFGRKNHLNWSARHLPLCFFHDYLSQISELRDKRMVISRIDTDSRTFDFVGQQKNERIKTKKCKGCKLYNICDGFFKEYFKHYGDEELKPVFKSFNKKIKINFRNIA